MRQMKNSSIALVLALAVITSSCLVVAAERRCGDRLERALDMMHQRSHLARRRYEPDSDLDPIYRQRLRSAPIDVSVTKLVVEIPNPKSNNRVDPSNWAKVERCSYEPSNNSIRTRVAFNELAVTGLVQLVAHDLAASSPISRQQQPEPRLLLPAESCRMSLRLRRAGMEFYTSPIARGRGQMRIRTESSFLEPRFASIYAYGCRPMVNSMIQPYSDRLMDSEPRIRRSGGAAAAAADADTKKTRIYDPTISDSANLLANSSAYDDSIEEENRLSGNVVAGNPAADALLDSLWRSRADIAREMEDVFLRSASQAITHYFEKQLHPAIKETLMLSMGYTISYG
ncbi:unnamed protein product [Trichogramma brassicae]|uniref:Uncharacterized protein n=1 Tax=Trichogramma brassicae TaxID=86971 RepID=A0A6H5I755_9HYME|nr:unnamed protein product [Trichogramma brassicae]